MEKDKARGKWLRRFRKKKLKWNKERDERILKSKEKVIHNSPSKEAQLMKNTSGSNIRDGHALGSPHSTMEDMGMKKRFNSRNNSVVFLDPDEDQD